MSALFRRASQILNDPVLREWLARKLLRLERAPAAFAPHCPPVVAEYLPLEKERGHADFSALVTTPPQTSIALPLPGYTHTVALGEASALFQKPQNDLECILALHRFAWLPLLGDKASSEWVAHLWKTWRERFGTPDGSWVWHPYTAAERAINMLDFGLGYGLPGPVEETVDLLAAHAPDIASKLEYFGAHNTGNHLANNGRGLYRLGCDLSLTNAQQLGRDILLSEAENILHPNGMLREGSSHYHYLYTRNYLDCFLAAERNGHEDDAKRFERIAQRMLGVCRTLKLSGRLPLIGDISPDCPPAFLDGLEAGKAQWPSLLGDQARIRVSEIAGADTQRIDVSDAGWWRLDAGPWQALWHTPRDGWSFIPGHGHQDIGAPEIHFNDMPLFIDPGRGAYGEDGDAALYRSAAVHGGLRIDGADPYPANKPYYSDAFRERVGGTAPRMHVTDHAAELAFHGYRRLGIDTVERRWTFSAQSLRIEDRIQGRGTHTIERTLVTAHEATISDGCVFVNRDGQRFRIYTEENATPRVSEITLWHAYGAGKAGHRIAFTTKAPAPWHGALIVEAIS